MPTCHSDEQHKYFHLRIPQIPYCFEKKNNSNNSSSNKSTSN